ncbi:MAG: helix-turn-helix domain-containing protein [Lachnospirales bacterium]
MKKIKILIVDDEILVRKGILMSIDWEKLGITDVFEASNGVEAFDIVVKERPNLVLTDIKMPKMNGITLIKKINEKYPSIIIIVLSCINDSDYIREALKYNRAIDYIPKLSISTNEIYETIEKVLKAIEINKLRKEYLPILANEDIRALKMKIIQRNEDEIKKSIVCIFTKAKAYYKDTKDFKEIQYIQGIFMDLIREAGGDINKINIDGENFYNYFETEFVEEMEYKILRFVPIYLELIFNLEREGLSKEIKKAIIFIRNNYNKDIRLQVVAKEIGLNETYLSRVFKEKIGVNFTEYLNKVRLEAAVDLLSTTNLTVFQVAQEVGYNSESYFSRIFKQYYGLSPKAYRKDA